ncbi:MAG: hypothetical protein A2860_02225 [Candidatus Levybacteria bacterium RIFCSPHIGHO2_01_FULL_37_33]|nr:MAG: hypothetical protein A2860_02225 [Candidatus Levybacteria bacterium RIFCSPHIGHO2_01_FULL_37_33]OGH33123.1 MAG: hypothetical protein A2953_03065 [Candidatus Levybacteria bacterium RIFCSPLOWO2_01_FULL_36_54]
MRRYRFLTKDSVYGALNKLRNAFLAARDGDEVNEIINGILSYDERLKIGRRILVAEMLKGGFTIEEIVNTLKVGRTTVLFVSRNLDQFPNCFELLEKRNNKVEKEYQNKKHRLLGGSKKIFKSKEYTGYKRSNVNR